MVNGVSSYPGLGNIDPGDLFYLEPNLNFAINDQVSISSGFRIGYLGRNKGSRSALVGLADTTQADLKLGMSFALTEKCILHSSVSANISDDGGSSVGIHMAYKLGD